MVRPDHISLHMRPGKVPKLGTPGADYRAVHADGVYRLEMLVYTGGGARHQTCRTRLAAALAARPGHWEFGDVREDASGHLLRIVVEAPPMSDPERLAWYVEQVAEMDRYFRPFLQKFFDIDGR